MREIKFRGKRLDNGEWVCGYYAKLPAEYTGVMCDYIFDSWFNGFGQCGNSIQHLIDIKTLGQSTGLKDKNGKEIYEGDIVEVPTIDEIGNVDLETLIYQKIVYEETMFLCKEVNQTKMASEGGGGASLMCFFVDGLNEIKVIGNITDNPELLEVEE